MICPDFINQVIRDGLQDPVRWSQVGVVAVKCVCRDKYTFFFGIEPTQVLKRLGSVLLKSGFSFFIIYIVLNYYYFELDVIFMFSL